MPKKENFSFMNYINRDNPKSLFLNLELLDSGSYGSVYKAFNTKRSNFCAIKIIPITNRTKIEAIEMEIAMLTNCKHKNIVELMGVYACNQDLWIVMEYMSEGNLTKLIEREKLSEPQIAFFCKEILLALQHLHDKKTVHRDIKTDNILLNDKGEVKLADFGFCCDLENCRKTTIGSPFWMA